MAWGQIKRFFIGKPLSADEAASEKIPKWKALAVLSSDALSSVAYATEAMLAPLLAFAAAATIWSIPIALAIVFLLVVVSASYRQTIEAYHNGGGAYVVAKENIGIYSGLTAGAALMIGYVMTAAVSVAAGVDAITSAVPELFPYRVQMSGIILLLITILNLRGISESASIFALPTYMFLFSFTAMIAVGCYKVFTGDVDYMADPTNIVNKEAYVAIAPFFVLRAFSSGCAALTGIEAISNGVPVFKPPSHKNAKATLTWMAFILCLLFVGITYLIFSYEIIPNDKEVAVSQLARAIFGTGPFYYLIQVSTALILVLAANTSFTGFPWLTSILAADRYLPRQLGAQGDRLVYSNAIMGLSAGAFFLIFIFGGDTLSLIPLYAVGVFLGFTLSQTGMLRHHLRNKKPGWVRGFSINLLGAVTTLVVTGVVAVTKFSQGAWISICLIAFMVLLFKRIHKHYLDIGKELTLLGVDAPENLKPFKHTVVVPISGVHRGVVDALRYALSISDDVRACYVEIDPEVTERVRASWADWGHEIPFVTLKSPYRSVIRPLLEYMDDLDHSSKRDFITVVIPEFVTRKWWHKLLHNQTAILIRAALLFKKKRVVTSVRYHLKST